MSDHKLAAALRDAQEQPFEDWWEREGQFARAGGGQYEKTFAWNAWCAALAAHEAEQQAGEAVMVYHGRCTIDCGENGHHNVELLRLIPAGTKLFTRPQQPLTEAQAIRLWHENAEAHRRESAFEWFAAGIIAGERAHGITKDAEPASECAHHYVRDDDAPTYHCCQKCGKVTKDTK